MRKKGIYIILLTLFTGLFISYSLSCKKDGDNDNGTTTGPGTSSAGSGQSSSIDPDTAVIITNVIPAGSGSIMIIPTKTTYNPDENVSILANGTDFNHWEGSLSGSANPVNYTIVAGQNIFTAVFGAASSAAGSVSSAFAPGSPGQGSCPRNTGGDIFSQ